MNRTMRVVLVFAAVCLVLLATGCTMLQPQSGQRSGMTQVSGGPGGGGGSGTSWSLGERAAPAMPVPTYAPAQDASGTRDQDTGQKIIYTARLDLEAGDVPAAVETLETIANASGGYTSSSTLSTRESGRKIATVVLRVPASRFEKTLTGAKAIGKVLSLSTTGNDVTEEYVDLVAQKTSYQNQIAQYTAILRKSEKVEDIIKVQEALDRVQTGLDRLEGRLRYLDSQVDLSTITVSIREPEPVGGETGHSFISAINSGIAGFLGMIDFLIIAFLTLLPVIILACVAYVVYRWYRSGRGKKGV